MTIALFGNALKVNIKQEIDHILEFMQLRGVNVILSQELRQEFSLRDYIQFGEETDEPIDFALSIGGDGTFLTTAALVGRQNIPILGINFGHLGFLAEVETKNLDCILDQLIRGQYTIEQRSLLAVRSGAGGNLSMPFALNEVAVMKYGLSSMIALEARVNGELLQRYEADGLVIATPTGSTAYNMSIGGPLMVPQARGIILSPIASHSLNVRPIVIPDDWKIDLSVQSRNGSYIVSIDGRSQILNDSVQLHVEKADYTVKVVQVGENSFIETLKTKLSWGN
ncbi:MAG: NAD kinase [Paludibacteraceae bacterium]|nr:NAD kinase [Paludibacteraceae bacterium]